MTTSQSSSPPTILIVDDDERQARCLARLLGLQYRVRTASSARSALRILVHWKADLVLSDYRMPGHTGIWLLRRARAMWPEARCVLMSGDVVSDTSAYIEHGVIDAFIPKPVGFQALYEKLNAVLGVIDPVPMPTVEPSARTPPPSAV